MQAEALAAVRVPGDLRCPDAVERAGLCLFDASWHQGVVGLVASRVKDRLRRPVIAFARAEDGTLRGSARSVAGVHIRDVLDAIATRHPGAHRPLRRSRHGRGADARARAPRCVRTRPSTTKWRAGVRRAAQRNASRPTGSWRRTRSTLETAQALRAAVPGGRPFRSRSFDGEFELRDARVVGERHLKLWVRGAAQRSQSSTPSPSTTSTAGAESRRLRARAHLVYRLDVNEYLGERRLQLVVEHLAARREARDSMRRLVPARSAVTMEVNQLKRQLKDLEERSARLRGFL